MLAQIQQVQAFKVAWSKTHPDVECQELMILIALATIIVINNDVVAVVSKPDDAVSNKLEVIARICLLYLLMKGLTVGFQLAPCSCGFHGTLLNLFFGRMLRWECVELMTHVKLVWDQTKSSGSHRILESYQGQPGDNQQTITLSLRILFDRLTIRW